MALHALHDGRQHRHAGFERFVVGAAVRQETASGQEHQAGLAADSRLHPSAKGCMIVHETKCDWQSLCVVGHVRGEERQHPATGAIHVCESRMCVCVCGLYCRWDTMHQRVVGGHQAVMRTSYQCGLIVAQAQQSHWAAMLHARRLRSAVDPTTTSTCCVRCARAAAEQ